MGHPEPIAEALRWGITIGELSQAYGRLRPHRRAEPLRQLAPRNLSTKERSAAYAGLLEDRIDLLSGNTQ